jgi:hypothetical protein
MNQQGIPFVVVSSGQVRQDVSSKCRGVRSSSCRQRVFVDNTSSCCRRIVVVSSSCCRVVSSSSSCGSQCLFVAGGQVALDKSGK